ncbi:MAG: putative heat resistant agglutinin 1 protein [Gammaproteobacteria bacterium]|jgi:opacity protein-like surface antigen|nr:putative heat resistant agglutinin 1 protein [Gammaproteobacteria bacterium]
MKINKLALGTFAAVAATTLSLPALAAVKSDVQPGFYAKAELGESFSQVADLQVRGNKANWDTPDDDYSAKIGNSLLGSIGIGYRISPLLRTDLTYTLRNQFDYSKYFASENYTRVMDIKNQTLMANIYVDANGICGVDFGRFNPYVGVGVGMARNETSNAITYNHKPNGTDFPAIETFSKNSFAWQFTAGTAISLTDNLSLDVGYRLVDLGKISTGSKAPDADYISPLATSSAYTHEAFVGVRYSFV